MIATVTLNPALDKSVTIPGFAAGRTNRASMGHVEVGGKGINVAKALKQLGCPVIALGFLAATDGRIIADALACSGIPGDFISVAGETRVNLKIKDPLTGVETEINEPGFRVEAGAPARRSSARSRKRPPNARSWCFREACRPALRRTFTRASCASPGVTAPEPSSTRRVALKHGIEAGPDLIKPNLAEAEEVLGEGIEGERRWSRAARRLLALGAGAVVISMGADGALAASGGEMWRADPPSIKAVEQHRGGRRHGGRAGRCDDAQLSLADALRLAMGAARGQCRDQRLGSRTRTIQLSRPGSFSATSSKW